MEDHREHAKAQVLLVEDGEMLRSILASALRDAGHNTVEAGTLHEALSALEVARFDVVVSDMRLPGGSAHQIADALGRLSEKPGLVLMTGDPNLFGDVECLGLAETLCLAKPFALSELLVSVATVASRCGAGCGCV